MDKYQTVVTLPWCIIPAITTETFAFKITFTHGTIDQIHKVSVRKTTVFKIILSHGNVACFYFRTQSLVLPRNTCQMKFWSFRDRNCHQHARFAFAFAFKITFIYGNGGEKTKTLVFHVSVCFCIQTYIHLWELWWKTKTLWDKDSKKHIAHFMNDFYLATRKTFVCIWKYICSWECWSNEILIYNNNICIFIWSHWKSHSPSEYWCNGILIMTKIILIICSIIGKNFSYLPCVYIFLCIQSRILPINIGQLNHFFCYTKNLDTWTASL